MKLKIEIDCDNQAFKEDLHDEIRTALDNVAYLISMGETERSLRDSNGNTIGKFKLGGK